MISTRSSLARGARSRRAAGRTVRLLHAGAPCAAGYRSPPCPRRCPSTTRSSPIRAPAVPTAGAGSSRPACASPSTSGAMPPPRRCCSPTAASTSPAPSTCSRPAWPTPAGGWWPGTSGATATPTTPRSTPGRPTCATWSPCSTRSAAGPLPLVGHSKGGGLIMQLAEAVPHRVPHLVNLDGLPSGARPRPTWPSTSAPARRSTRWPAGSTTGAAPTTPCASRARSTSWPAAGGA